MSNFLDARIAFRLLIVLAGAMLAGSRRTASRWFRTAGVADDWDPFYDIPRPARPTAHGCSDTTGFAWPSS